MTLAKLLGKGNGASLGLVFGLAAMLCVGAAQAVPCRTGGPYEKWLADFEREAMAQGVSQRTIATAAPFLTYDQKIVNIDRGQRVFSQTFLEFSDRMAAGYRIQMGAAKIKTYAQVFARIDQQYGVPAPVIVAFWALESDFGANMGNYHSLSSIASLSYDCRRADRFRSQLLDAMRLIERGDLQPQEMIGSWAGELGQTQMMPSDTTNTPSITMVTASAICCAAPPTCSARQRIISSALAGAAASPG